MSATCMPTSTAPYCADPEGDAWLGPRVEAARDMVLAELGESVVEALVLTGSLARGEASVAPAGASPRLLGDVEFLLVVRPRGSWRDLRRRVQAIGRRATEELSGPDGRFAVEFTPADASYLRERARPSAFTWDLRRHGRVVFGNPDILDEIPPFERSALPPEDALETLLNRGLELLALEEKPEERESLAYAMVKALLDGAGSALGFAGVHESLYAVRSEALRRLLVSRRDLAEALPEKERLVALVGAAAATKLRPTEAALRRFEHEVDPPRVRRWLSELWRWEAGQWLGKPRAETATLVDGYLTAEPWPDRARGWAKYAWHPLRPATAPLAPALLGLLSCGCSPRRRVYGAAALAVEGLAGWEDRARRVLAIGPSMKRAILPEILETWTWLVRNN